MLKRKLKKHRSGRGMSPALIHALDHPLRRQVLRLLHEEGKSLSPAELMKSIKVSLSTLSYHTRALHDLGVTRQTHKEQVRGATKHFYTSAVADNEHVAAILAETERDDA